MLPAVVIFRVRTAVLPPVLIVVVALGFDVLTRVVERVWSFRGAANASDPVNSTPVTAPSSMRFVFISLFWF